MKETVVTALFAVLLVVGSGVALSAPGGKGGSDSGLEGLTDAFSHQLPMPPYNEEVEVQFLVSQQSTIPLAGLNRVIAQQPDSKPESLVTGAVAEIPQRVAVIDDKDFSDSSANCSDMDLDGVCDSQDHCQLTPKGSVVMPHGCHLTLGVPLELVGVFFDFNGYRLRPESKEILDRVAALLKQRDSVTVEVAGHTDSKGKAETNRLLSERRAKSVYDYLIEQGVESYRLSYQGYGESLPVSANKVAGNRDNPAGRARNRRVELRVTGSLAARE